MTAKFQPGDRVKSLRNHPALHHHGGLVVGEIYTVRSVDGAGRPILTNEAEHSSIGWPPQNFELHAKAGEFGVGDRVVCIESNRSDEPQGEPRGGIVGRVYTVQRVNQPRYGSLSWLALGDGTNSAIGAYRFRLATAEEIAAADAPKPPTSVTNAHGTFKVGDKFSDSIAAIFSDNGERTFTIERIIDELTVEASPPTRNGGTTWHVSNLKPAVAAPLLPGRVSPRDFRVGDKVRHARHRWEATVYTTMADDIDGYTLGLQQGDVSSTYRPDGFALVQDKDGWRPMPADGKNPAPGATVDFKGAFSTIIGHNGNADRATWDSKYLFAYRVTAEAQPEPVPQPDTLPPIGVGDVVEAIRTASENDLTAGKRYTLSAPSERLRGHFRFTLTDDRGLERGADPTARLIAENLRLAIPAGGFKPGDVVLCVGHDLPGATKGKRYDIVSDRAGSPSWRDDGGKRRYAGMQNTGVMESFRLLHRPVALTLDHSITRPARTAPWGNATDAARYAQSLGHFRRHQIRFFDFAMTNEELKAASAPAPTFAPVELTMADIRANLKRAVDTSKIKVGDKVRVEREVLEVAKDGGIRISNTMWVDPCEVADHQPAPLRVGDKVDALGDPAEIIFIHGRQAAVIESGYLETYDLDDLKRA